MRRFRKLAIGATLASALVACTTTYPVVGKFSDHNEVFLGQVNHNLTSGQAFIEATGKNTGLRCRGVSRVVYIPTSNYVAGAFMIPYCAGQKGIAVLRCDDGRSLTADWTADSCSSGRGGGEDQRGARFDFVFGLSEQEALAKLGQYQTEVAGKPDLPVYRPKEERKKRGYATGTGFFVSADGHLLTNHHVVDGSTTSPSWSVGRSDRPGWLATMPTTTSRCSRSRAATSRCQSAAPRRWFVPTRSLPWASRW